MKIEKKPEGCAATGASAGESIKLLKATQTRGQYTVLPLAKEIYEMQRNAMN